MSSTSPSHLTVSMQMRIAVACPEPYCTPARTGHKSRHLIFMEQMALSSRPPQNPTPGLSFICGVSSICFICLEGSFLPLRLHTFPLISLGSILAPYLSLFFSLGLPNTQIHKSLSDSLKLQIASQPGEIANNYELASPLPQTTPDSEFKGSHCLSAFQKQPETLSSHPLAESKSGAHCVVLLGLLWGGKEENTQDSSRKKQARTRESDQQMLGKEHLGAEGAGRFQALGTKPRSLP